MIHAKDLRNTHLFPEQSEVSEVGPRWSKMVQETPLLNGLKQEPSVECSSSTYQICESNRSATATTLPGDLHDLSTLQS